MTVEVPPAFALEAAQARGALAPGRHRVVVLEPSGDLRVSDFDTLEGATDYANDVASESDDPSPIAYIFDDGLRFVGRGRHYAS